MRRLFLPLCLLALASPAWAADMWRTVTVSGSGGQTGDKILCFVHSSSVASCITRGATSKTNALTVYRVTGSGTISATDYTLSNITNFTSIWAVGGNSSYVCVGGKGLFRACADIATMTWNVHYDFNDSTYVLTGLFTTDPSDSTYYRVPYTGSTTYKFNLSRGLYTSNSGGDLATATIAFTSATELMSVQVGSSWTHLAVNDNNTHHLGYVSGSSFAFNRSASQAAGIGSTYFRPPFQMNGTLAVMSLFNGSRTFIEISNSSGTLTEFNKTENLVPGCAWDPTGSLDRGWWIRRATSAGQAYRTDSISAPTTITHADTTYDIGSTELQSGDPLTMLCGLDVDGDASSTDNPVVIMNNKALAYWGEPISSRKGGAPSSPLSQAIQVLRGVLP